MSDTTNFLLTLSSNLCRYNSGFIFLCINDDKTQKEVVNYINENYNSTLYSLLDHHNNCELTYHIKNYCRDYDILILTDIKEYNKISNYNGYQKLEFMRESLLDLNKLYIFICKENELNIFANELANIFSCRLNTIYYNE